MYLPGMSAYGSLKRALAHISLTTREELKADKISVSVVYPDITLTDFEKNTIKAKPREKSQQGNENNEGGDAPYPPDTSEYVAQKIIECIESGEAEIFAHDWMKNLKRQE